MVHISVNSFKSSPEGALTTTRRWTELVMWPLVFKARWSNKALLVDVARAAIE